MLKHHTSLTRKTKNHTHTLSVHTRSNTKHARTRTHAHTTRTHLEGEGAVAGDDLADGGEDLGPVTLLEGAVAQCLHMGGEAGCRAGCREDCMGGEGRPALLASWRGAYRGGLVGMQGEGPGLCGLCCVHGCLHPGEEAAPLGSVLPLEVSTHYDDWPNIGAHTQKKHLDLTSGT